LQLARRRTLAVLAAAAASAAPTGLYGTTPQVGLATISTATGAVTPVGTPAAAEGQAQQLSALDAARGIYYLLGWNFTSQAANLVGFSVATGGVVVDVALPFYESAFVGLGQVLAVEPATGQLVGGGLLRENSSHVFGFISPTNGSFTQVAALDAALLPVLGGVADYDPSSGTLLTQLGDRSSVYWYSISLRNGSYTRCVAAAAAAGAQERGRSGACGGAVPRGILRLHFSLARGMLVSSPPPSPFVPHRWAEDFTHGKDIQSLDYDAGSGAFYGLGLEPNGTTSYIRTLVRLDATKFTYTTVRKHSVAG
jgi:hypothetical protein